jgi:DNA-binding transcriptional LysR family regulator
MALTTRSNYIPSESKRSFIVAASDYVVNVLILEVQRRIYEEAPGVILEIVPIRTAVFEHLQRAEIDLVIVPDTYPVESCPGELLFRDEFACVAWDGNDAVGATVTMEQYIALDHVFMQPEKGHTIWHNRWLQTNYGVTPNVKLTLPSFAFLPEAVIGTNRLAMVPRRLIEIYAKALPLKAVTPLFEVPSLVEMAYWHSSRNVDPGLAWLRGMLRDAIASTVSEP